MNIYGVGVVQNEADILGESIEWALRFCEHIWLWDLGSTDETPAVATMFPRDRVTLTARPRLRFSSSLKGRVFAEARSNLPTGAWIYIFDADEFLEGPLDDAIRQADAQQADKIGVWQANFYPTNDDLHTLQNIGESAWIQQPIGQRLRHYRVEWFEWRFIRHAFDLEWDTSGPHSIWRRQGRALKPCRFERLFVRHYRYRSPHQVATRHQIRQTSPIPGYGQFRYDRSDRFEDLVRPAAQLSWWPPGQPWAVPAFEMVQARLRICAFRLLRKFERLRGR